MIGDAMTIMKLTRKGVFLKEQEAKVTKKEIIYLQSQIDVMNGKIDALMDEVRKLKREKVMQE